MKNSFISFLEQLALLNKNATDILTKINDVVSAEDNSVTINYSEENGTVTTYEMPTINYLKKEIEIANANIQKIIGFDDTSVVLTDNIGSKKIKKISLNREPIQIPDIDIVTKFDKNLNWFFESLLNPLISVNINLDNKIDEHVRKILSRRYIIKFERDDNNELTEAGQNSLTYFEANFLNKNDFSIVTFQNWLNLETNTGIINKNENIDEQYFDLNWKEIKYKGYFSVLKLEKDTINNKYWYHLNTLTYYDRTGNNRILSTGDILSLTRKESFAKFKILEINTSSSLFRVRLERIEGYEPVPIGTSVLEYYSNLVSQNNVNITVGYDEYNTIFVKPVNIDNNIIGSTWSKGTSFYTNDLLYSDDNTISLPNYYVNNVYDYGAVLKDLVSKRIPSQYASKPNIPILNTDNFKVIQINKHLTDTKDADTLKKLHSEKNAVKSRLEQLNESITEKNKELNTKKYKSVAEKSKSQNELDKLIKRQESETKLYASYVNQITNTIINNNIEPKFRVRGFWDIPEPIIKLGTKTQEVIGFEIQYRYSSKSGNDNVTEGFDLKTMDNNIVKKKTGYFSKWIPLKTDIRQRYFNNEDGKWYWKIEDISDADTPNINQLDIAIQQDEKVDIKIRSISEVGYPDNILYSDFSDIITIEFPDNLKTILKENEFILKEASQEEVKVKFETELTSKGITRHVLNSFYTNEKYVAHKDKEIETSFKDEHGNSISLYDYLIILNNKISTLEEEIKRAKGELKVVLFNGTDETTVTNNSTINLTINCENYMKETSATTYTVKEFYNNIYLIQDFYLKFENLSENNPLSLLTDKNLYDIITNDIITEPTFVDSNGLVKKQSNNQFIWLLDEYNNINLYDGDVSNTADAPNVLTTNNKNLGGSYNNTQILDNSYWYSNSLNYNVLGSTIQPYLENVNDVINLNDDIYLIEGQDSFKLPLNIYFKPDLSSSGNTVNINTVDIPIVINKRIRLRLDNEFSPRPFKFVINFKLIRHNQYLTV